MITGDGSLRTCPYCEGESLNLPRHLVKMHSSEKDVAAILSCQFSKTDARRMISKLMNIEKSPADENKDFERIESVQTCFDVDPPSVTLTVHQSSTVNPGTVQCQICLQNYSKRDFHKHMKQCEHSIKKEIKTEPVDAYIEDIETGKNI